MDLLRLREQLNKAKTAAKTAWGEPGHPGWQVDAVEPTEISGKDRMEAIRFEVIHLPHMASYAASCWRCTVLGYNLYSTCCICKLLTVKKCSNRHLSHVTHALFQLHWRALQISIPRGIQRALKSSPHKTVMRCHDQMKHCSAAALLPSMLVDLLALRMQIVGKMFVDVQHHCDLAMLA